MMTKREARYMAEIRKAEGIAYTLPEDGLAPLDPTKSPVHAEPITVDAEGFWRAVMDVNATNAPDEMRERDAIGWARRIRAEDEPGEDEHPASR